MSELDNRIQDLINRPSESLAVEVKNWIDPDTTEGQAKIVKNLLALRNHGGGYLVIGFDDESLQPSLTSIPSDVKAKFHIDKIQALIGSYASEVFEITISFPELDDQSFPVISVPSGVKSPVAAKADLINPTDPPRKLITVNDVYVRTLRTNNTPSTAKATWKDWPKVVETCFDNREADIGRFLRRHLSGLKIGSVIQLMNTLERPPQSEQNIQSQLTTLLEEGEQRFTTVLSDRSQKLPLHGAWEVALIIDGNISGHSANKEFLNLLDANNPDYTGWPVWLNSTTFANKDAHPYVFNKAWEALIISMGTNWSDHVDFMRIDPSGKFYLRRALQDDISGTAQSPKPLTQLDFGLPVLRVAETIAVGLAFAKAMECEIDNTSLHFAFKWSCLSKRKLSNWAQRNRSISDGYTAHQDEAIIHISLPLNTPFSAIGEYVNSVIQELFQLFDGFTLSKEIVDDLVTRLLERKL